MKHRKQKQVTKNSFWKAELPAYPYFFSVVHEAPKQKYRDKFLMGGWYQFYRFGKPTIIQNPISSYAVPGRSFLKLLLKNDVGFREFLFKLCLESDFFSKRLMIKNYKDLKNGRVSDLREFYPEYKKLFSKAIGIGYSLDYALDEYIKKNKINTNLISIERPSFLSEEMIDFQKNKKKLGEHLLKYSWIQNNYHGEKRIDKSYLSNRKSVADIGEFKRIKIEMPSNFYEWISLLIYFRDLRKKINLIAIGLLDRYLKKECKRWNLDYDRAVMLTVDEFEKMKTSSLKDFYGARIFKISKYGIRGLSLKEWNRLFLEKESFSSTKEMKGMVGNKGKVTGKVRVIIDMEDLFKFNIGEILVTSMTRPEFAPLMKKAAAVITDEGGITCHAAITSRELGKPCIIGTKIATKVLKDGDLVEVDADKGIVRILKKKN